ncbi:TonB-dependent receptor [Winogradskyella thalassocola]|uniref:Iron complex outermembrane recepter protein n=1 Tax=Winogradskyella thalassocola TaxID=262004 RepID=A0A1G8DDT7_9FLAO|nr:TonB-dependent receptor [Winogradskyella thalassocola]SDH55793.1 iron complex outermembrane recepter protein [Winogradskyella thalassocola]
MKSIIIGVLIAISSFSYSQNCNYIFLGEVKDFHDGTAIESATIHIKESDKYLISDLDGKFKIENLCSGTLTLTISHIGCETKTVSYSIENDVFKIISLEHHLEELNEVVVNSHLKTEGTSIEQTLNKADLEKYTDKSLGDALNSVSGVSSLNTGNTIVKPMIHGLHSSRLLIINNNVRMFDQEWGDEHAPNIDINASNKVEVIKGANTLKYGSDAIGGLILIQPKRYVARDSLFGSTMLSLNSNGRGGNVNSELIKTYKSGFYGRIQTSYKQFGDFEGPDYKLTNSGLKNINASARIGYRSFEKGFDAYYSVVSNELGILQASHIGNVNDLVTAINSRTPRVIEDFSYDIDYPKQNILHNLAKIEAYKRFKNFGKLSVQYDMQINRRKEYDLRRGDLANTPVIDLRLFTNSLQTNLNIDAIDNLKLDTGILVRYQQNDAISGTGVSPLIPDFEKYDASIYAIGNFDLNDSSELSAGARYDFTRINAEKLYNLTDWEETYNYDELFPQFETNTVENSKILTRPEFTFHNISANVGYSKQFNNDISLFVNYGLATRVPNPSELFSDGLHHSAARIETGLLTLNKEIANKFVASLERNNQNFGFSISPYFKHINDYIQLIPVGITTTIRGAFPVWEYNQINAQIFGVDIDVNKKITDKFNYKGSISLLKGENLTEDIPLIHMPSTNFTNSISYYNDELNQLSINLTHKTVLQQNEFPDYNFYTFNPILQEDVYVDISSTPPAYSLFSFNSSVSFKAFKTGSLKLELNVENLLNTKYNEYLNRQRYFADELGRNINLKIKINY